MRKPSWQSGSDVTLARLRKQYHTRLIGADRHTWDVHRLLRIAKELPVERVLLSDIGELDENWWFQDANPIVSPRALADHMRLVEAADLSFPVLLCADGRLMDGMHRVVKALTSGETTIRAIRLKPTPDPDFINVEVDRLPYPHEDI